MQLRDLTYFVAVAETGGFTAAAERLHVVQSGVSASIRSLERQLGAPLFDRVPRSVVLTDAGRTPGAPWRRRARLATRSRRPSTACAARSPWARFPCSDWST